MRRETGGMATEETLRQFYRSARNLQRNLEQEYYDGKQARAVLPAWHKACGIRAVLNHLGNWFPFLRPEDDKPLSVTVNLETGEAVAEIEALKAEVDLLAAKIEEAKANLFGLRIEVGDPCTKQVVCDCEKEACADPDLDNLVGKATSTGGRAVCAHCGGTGYNPVNACKCCGGTGSALVSAYPCPACNGTGVWS